MAKKNKEIFEGGGGTNSISSAISDNHEIKIAILLWFSPELYLRILLKKKKYQKKIYQTFHFGIKIFKDWRRHFLKKLLIRELVLNLVI